MNDWPYFVPCEMPLTTEFVSSWRGWNFQQVMTSRESWLRRKLLPAGDFAGPQVGQQHGPRCSHAIKQFPHKEVFTRPGIDEAEIKIDGFKFQLMVASGSGQVDPFQSFLLKSRRGDMIGNKAPLGDFNVQVEFL